ncbi:hypothetical protein RIR_jg12080.t1 [Rhizophagus irregularis DAOM 181602=DAOM 197198]|uniref:SAM domain-containing protein n=1 Tax=Rhizophagus irregularis (strain DAOM 197198w) TaxID=1432141 RepID=A0A015KQA8_RHIIW|nr:hypothetical protein RirG_166030 [Rhizophagus irregularis DAOM 197198w]GET61982.1 hypothetical protein RIR_jg12080.t1 [Rhizophagus irregularis DAOM 181602=DAOM 197198]
MTWEYSVRRKLPGQDFFDMTKEDFKECGLEMGPAMRLAKEVQALKEKLKRVFSSYKSLSEVLAKYGIDGNVRLKNYGTLVMDSLEAMRNEYIVAILHSAINITRDDTGKELSMRPEYEVIGEESSGQVDYAIKDVENLICITEDKSQWNVIEGFAQNIKQLESSYETNKRK